MHRFALPALAVVLLAASRPSSAQPQPTLPLLAAAAITARCDDVLAAGRKTLQAMEARKDSTTVLADFNALSILMADFTNPVYLLQNVSPDAATRDAAQACLDKLVPFDTEVFQSTGLLARVQEMDDPEDRP